MTDATQTPVSLEELSLIAVDRVNRGARFGGLFASAKGDETRLTIVLVSKGSIETHEAIVAASTGLYPALSPQVPAAHWYEREIHDLFGLDAVGAAKLDPLVFPFQTESPRPRPGSGAVLGLVEPDLTPLMANLRGEGVFTIPYGPVRSGVFESIEFLVETPGEDIPHLRTRVFYKHRGVESRFEGLSTDDGALLAERCEGVASVAHATAYCGAVERLAGAEISPQAGLVRVIHAELERVANHLDSTIRHTEAAGQAVAYARFSLHKERVQRLRAQLCGSRFSRGVVVPGGVSGPLQLISTHLLAAIGKIEGTMRSDVKLLMATPSFLDRLRATGVLSPEIARRFGALGPLGRGSGQFDDARLNRPYAAYGRLGHRPQTMRDEGDALARQHVRLEEIWDSFHLIRQATDELDELGDPGNGLWRAPIGSPSGKTIGWAEAPQGEVLYLVEIQEGRLVRVKPRSASFHNLVLFPAAFPKDVLTDFAFIEASFGISIAGAAG